MKIEPTADARKQKNKREKRGRWQWWAKSCGARTRGRELDGVILL